MTLRHPDAIGSIVIALVALLVIAAGLATPDPGFGVVGPAVFPIAIGALMLVVAAWLGWDTWRRAAPMVLDPIDRWPFVRSLLATAAFLVAFEPVGFMISGAAYLVVQSRIFGSRALVRDIVSAVLFMTALYLVFVRFLTIGLPNGPLPF